MADAERRRTSVIARIRLDRLLHCEIEYGRPSGYSLSRLELARHVRQLRRDGWMGWEVAARFDFGRH